MNIALYHYLVMATKLRIVGYVNAKLQGSLPYNTTSNITIAARQITTMKTTRLLWVVEYRQRGSKEWSAIQASVTREDGRTALKNHKQRSPSEEYRLVPYTPKHWEV